MGTRLDDIQKMYERATALANQDPVAALPLFEQVLATAPNHYYARFSLIMVLLSLGRRGQALEQMERVAAHASPNDVQRLEAAVGAAIAQKNLIGTGYLVDDTWRLGRLLGRGAQAAVFAATAEEDPHTEVAVKLLLQAEGNLAAHDRLDREFHILQELAHPNILTSIVRGIDRLSGVPYIVTELLHGQSLAALLRRGPLPPERAVAIVLDILDALQAAHAQGIVHRDIKPENVMLRDADTPNERVCVFDFGVATILQDAAPLTKTGLILGTCNYLAPEYLRGDGPAPSNDIYAVGLVLGELLGGKRLVGPTDPIQCVAIHLAGRLDRPQTGDPHLDQILDEACALDTAKRFASCAAFARALEGWRDHPQTAPLPTSSLHPAPNEPAPTLATPIPATPPTAGAPRQSSPRPGRALLIAIGAIVTLALGAIVIAFTTGPCDKKTVPVPIPTIRNLPADSGTATPPTPQLDTLIENAAREAKAQRWPEVRNLLTPTWRSEQAMASLRGTPAQHERFLSLLCPALGQHAYEAFATETPDALQRRLDALRCFQALAALGTPRSGIPDSLSHLDILVDEAARLPALNPHSRAILVKAQPSDATLTLDSHPLPQPYIAYLPDPSDTRTLAIAKAGCKTRQLALDADTAPILKPTLSCKQGAGSKLPPPL